MSEATRRADPDLPEPGFRVALHARDPGRLGALLAVLATEGITADADAEWMLVDLGPGESAPEDVAGALILTDDPLLLRESDAPGTLPRDAAAGQIAAALRAIAAGLHVRPRGFDTDGFAGDDSPDGSPGETRVAAPLLTPRELEILAAVGDGLSNKAVARLLGISSHTVKFHLEAVFGKLGARTRAEAVAKGLRRGLIEA